MKSGTLTAYMGSREIRKGTQEQLKLIIQVAARSS